MATSILEPCGAATEVRERQRTVLPLSRSVERVAVDIVYQPIVALAGFQTVAVETLVRRSDPASTPDVGLSVVQAACRQAGQWTASDWCADLRVHVGVSAAEIVDPTCVAIVAGALAAAGIDPARLVIQVGEDHLGSASAAQTLHTLKALGVGIAIDRFGAGFGRLARLRGLIDYVKIDAALVRGLSAAGSDRDIARVIFSMCESLGVTSIAGGVGGEAQAAELRGLGCTLAQGSAWSLALPSTRFGLWLGQQRHTLRQSA